MTFLLSLVTVVGHVTIQEQACSCTPVGQIRVAELVARAARFLG